LTTCPSVLQVSNNICFWLTYLLNCTKVQFKLLVASTLKGKRGGLIVSSQEAVLVSRWAPDQHQQQEQTYQQSDRRWAVCHCALTIINSVRFLCQLLYNWLGMTHLWRQPTFFCLFSWPTNYDQ